MPDAARPGVSTSEVDELPTEKGFLVQLTRDTGPNLVPFAGRVEHLASGHRLRFADFEDFRLAVRRLLETVRKP